MLIAASRKEKVEDRVAAAEAAGLKALVMDVESFATQTAFELIEQQLPDNAVRSQAIDLTYATLRRYGRAEVELSHLLDRPTAEDELRNLFDEVGLESIRTTYGTVYRSVKTQYQVNDWDSMYKFVMEHNVPQLLQRRVSPTNMKQFLDENPNLMPMGMNIDNRYTVTVRRSKS